VEGLLILFWLIISRTINSSEKVLFLFGGTRFVLQHGKSAQTPEKKRKKGTKKTDNAESIFFCVSVIG